MLEKQHIVWIAQFALKQVINKKLGGWTNQQGWRKELFLIWQPRPIDMSTADQDNRPLLDPEVGLESDGNTSQVQLRLYRSKSERDHKIGIC